MQDSLSNEFRRLATEHLAADAKKSRETWDAIANFSLENWQDIFIAMQSYESAHLGVNLTNIETTTGSHKR